MNAGYNCHGLDAIGHGRSPGLPSYVPNMSFIVNDITDYTLQLQRQYAAPAPAASESKEPDAGAPEAAAHTVPFFILGESMGGALTALVIAEGRVKFAGAVLVAPMCGIDPVGV